MIGSIGHYQILAELGRGGMGVVYKGYEPALDRHVAIKMLAQTLSHDQSVKERFLREARSMAALNDPHIIQIYFIGEESGQPYFAMEFIDGESLSSFLKREGKCSPGNAAKLIQQTALGLATAHDKGVIHRDIKPGNLMLSTRGVVKIADFGIALSAQDFAKKLTSTGEFVGTPGYLSPEVCTGNLVDQRSDIFSLGIVLFELLTGRMPFNDQSPLGLMLEVVRAEIPDVRQLNAEVDAELTEILRRMTAKDPAQRYASCHELADALSAHPLVAKGGPISIRAKVPTLAAVAAANRDQVSLPVSRPSPVSNSYATEVERSRAPAAPVAATEVQARASGSDLAAALAQVSPSAAPEAPRASVLERQSRPSSNGLWPIAAGLAIVALGASAFVFGDRLPGVRNLFGGSEPTPPAQLASAGSAPASAADATSAPASVVGASPAAEPAPGADSDMTTGASGIPNADAPAGAADPGSSAQAAYAQAEPVPPPPPEPPAPPASTPDQPPAIAGVALEPEQDSANLQPLKRIADSRRDVLLAKAAPPEPVSAPPKGPPKVAVIAIGDPAIVLPAKHVLEETLSDEGFLLVDSDMAPGVQRLLRSGRPDVPAVLSALARSHGVRAVTVVRAEPLGTTQLNYYGQSDTLFSVNLTVKSYDTDNRSPLGSGFMSKVDFTALNAQAQAREAIEPEMRRYLSTLSPFKPRGRNE